MGNAIKRALWSVLVVFISITALSAAIQNMKELQTSVADSFDSPQERTWTENGQTKTEARTWTVKGSMHAATDTPELKFIEGEPDKRSFSAAPTAGKSILGIRSKFNYRGYNFFEITPMTGDQVGFMLPGNARQLSVWIWGSNYNYTLEAQFADHNGKVYVVPMGSLQFLGWRNLTIRLSESYTKTKYNPWGESLRFLRFAVRTAPSERVHDFQVYFDDLTVQTIVDQSPHSGGELFDPEKINAIWANGQ